MKKIYVSSILAVVALLLTAPFVSAQTDSTTSVYIDSIAQFGRPVGDFVVEGYPVTFFVRFEHNYPAYARSTSLGFIYWAEANGEYTGNQTNALSGWMPGIDWWQYFDGTVSHGYYPPTELGPDSVRFSDLTIFADGLPPGFNELSLFIGAVPGKAGDTLCLDSSEVYATGWDWSLTGVGLIIPDWGGRICIPVTTCCNGSQANLDISSGPGPQADITDLTMLVSYIFPPHDPLLCGGVGNFDGLISGGVPIDIVDLTMFVDYLFFGGSPPAACNE